MQFQGQPIVHVDLASQNQAASASFYQAVFGWKTHREEAANYTMFESEGGPGGGFTQIDREYCQPGEVVAYIWTDDVEESLRQIEANGGKTVMPKMPIPGGGALALFTDPSGTKVGLYNSEQS